jgi:GT2 family glycosyltransferase
MLKHLKISTVIPTYNRGDILIATLEAMNKQTLNDESLEIIVVNDGSSDDTSLLVKKWAKDCSRNNVKFIDMQQNSGKAVACNKGIRIASSPYILFIDDDCVPEPSWAEYHLKRQHEATESIGILGSVWFPDEWIKESNFVRYFQSRYVGNRSWKSIKGGPEDIPPNLMGGLNVSYPKKSLVDVGMFTEGFGRGQDVDLAYRLWKNKVRFVYDDQPKVIHYSPEMESFEIWLSKYLKVYNPTPRDTPKLSEEYVSNFGHWFLNSPRMGEEPIYRTAVKCILRIVCKNSIALKIKEYLIRTDSEPSRYHPLLYIYVITTLSLRKNKENFEKSHDKI